MTRCESCGESHHATRISSSPDPRRWCSYDCAAAEDGQLLQAEGLRRRAWEALGTVLDRRMAERARMTARDVARYIEGQLAARDAGEETRR